MAKGKPRSYMCIVCQNTYHSPHANGMLPDRCPACKEDPAAAGVKAHRCNTCNRNWPIGRMVSGPVWRYCKACKKTDERFYTRHSPRRRVYRQTFEYKRSRALQAREYRQRPEVKATLSARRREYMRHYYQQRKANGDGPGKAQLRAKAEALRRGLKRYAIDLVLEQARCGDD